MLVPRADEAADAGHLNVALVGAALYEEVAVYSSRSPSG